MHTSTYTLEHVTLQIATDKINDTLYAARDLARAKQVTITQDVRFMRLDWLSRLVSSMPFSARNQRPCTNC